MLPWGSEAERERAQRIADARPAARRCRGDWARRAGEPRSSARAAVVGLDTGLDALRRRARRADGRHLLRLGPGAHRHLRRAAGEQRRRAWPRRLTSPKCCKLICMRGAAIRSRCACAAAHPAAAVVARPARAGLPRSASASASATTAAPRPEKVALGARGVGGRGARGRAAGAGAQGSAARPRGADDLHHRGRPRDLKQLYGESVIAAWLPYDYPGSVRRFLEHFRPTPGHADGNRNLAEPACRLQRPRRAGGARQRAHVGEVGARLSALARADARPAIRSLTAVCAQSEADAARLRDARRAARRGDRQPEVRRHAWTPRSSPPGASVKRAALGRPVLLLASTREGEEKLLLSSSPAWVTASTLVVPRHPQRFDEVAQLGATRRRSRNAARPQERVYLGDTMGEMAFYYAAADVAVIGGIVRCRSAGRT